MKLALIGNPNSGKTSLFNTLTGLRQKTGNFPGVTIEKVTGRVEMGDRTCDLVDLPGTYSLYPISKDEHIVTNVLLNPDTRPDGIVYVADANKLEQHLLLYSQVSDLGIPIFLVLTMADLKSKLGTTLDLQRFSSRLNAPISEISLTDPSSVNDLKKELEKFTHDLNAKQTDIYELSKEEKKWTASVSQEYRLTDYGKLLLLHHYDQLDFITEKQKSAFSELANSFNINSTKNQVEETLTRFKKIESFIKEFYHKEAGKKATNSFLADKLLTHSVLGPAIFLLIIFLVLQAIFLWAEAPMEWIEGLFSWISTSIGGIKSLGFIGDLLADGIIPGIAGVMVFIPQIAILFLLLGLLEESGYMARAVYLFDNLMRRFGLNGRSLVALVSGSACAIPAIMSTRSIKNRTERLITIMVTPFVSCSARTPVYIVLTGFVVGQGKVFGWISKSALVFMGCYLLGMVAVFVLAFVLKKILKSEEQSYLMIELPNYQWPRIRTVLLNTWNKVKSFIVEAGKIIFIISILLWLLSSYGPGDHRAQAVQMVESNAGAQSIDEEVKSELIAAKELELSYAGRLGKLIEPAIRPLGFDWKIGIALLTSFAAREVFVSTMATIYSLGSEEDEINIKNRMAQEINPRTGKPLYNRATALSLIVFYILAMQCMSTLAVVKKETGSWKWPTLQFFVMTGSAYIASLLVYQLLS